MGRTYHYLPEDVVEEILLRLPVKSLLRFKCVCKSWYRRIGDRSFADTHLRFNKKISPSSASLFFTHKDCHLWELPSLITLSNADHDNDLISCLVEDLDFSQILGIDDACLMAGSHCDGIISLTFLFSGTTVLYNPAIRDLKPLSPPLLPHGFKLKTAGFGYDSKANDYKFVRISYSMNKECIADVYTLGSDCWKQVKIKNIEIDIEFRFWETGVCCKGIYCWWVPRVRPQHTILSFDMSSDELHVIPLPDNMQRDDHFLSVRLVVWNESVAVLFFPDHRKGNSFEMWVMDAGRSWKKHLSVGPLIGIRNPIVFWKSDELLMDTEDGQLVSYNLGTQKLRNLPIHEKIQGPCYADFYMPSLVSVNRGK